METSVYIKNQSLTEDKLSIEEKMVQFYDEATQDYAFWSTSQNMHFGYFRFLKTNPLRRDSMLNEMNNQIIKRIKINTAKNIVVDLGCGMGATMRQALNKNPNLSMIGVTLSNFQVKEGNKLLKNLKGIILKEDYTNTSLLNSSADGVIAIESFCHRGHDMKSLQEAYRILKPGKQLVIADAFLKKSPNKLCYGSSFCHKKMCKKWHLQSLGEINEIKKNLLKIGFRKVEIEDVSMRVMPSVLHVPFTVIGFPIKKLLENKPVKKQSWKNITASLYALLSGLHRKAFGYYIVTATK